MSDRRRLRDVTLTGGRAALRAMLFGGIAIGAILAGIGYVLPAHRVVDAPAFHSNYADGGPVVLVLAAAVAGAWIALRGRRHGAGYALGVVSAGAAFGAAAATFISHLFSEVESSASEGVYVMGVLGMFGLGVILVIAEPILYLGQRRQLERDVDPRFPTARVVDR